MKLTCQAISVLLFGLLLVQVQASSKYSYSFPFNSTGLSPEFSLVYRLGTFSAGSSISVTVSATPAAVPMSIFQTLSKTLNSNNYQGLKYYDNTSGSPVIRPVVDINGGLATLPPAYSTSSYSFTLPIYFPSDFAPTSAEFILVIADNKVMSGLFIGFTIEVINYPGKIAGSVEAAMGGRTVLKAVDIMRSHTNKVIYVSQPGQVFNFTAFPAAFCTTGSGASCSERYTINVASIPTPISSSSSGFNGNYLTLGPRTQLISIEKAASATVYPGNTAHYSYNFTTIGYYTIDFQMTYTGVIDGTITFNSDAYACPFPSGFADYYGTFQACIAPKSSSGLPCSVYDPNLAVCTLCFQGYDLISGSCIANTTCPARQYFSYGECVNVSSLCGAFDAFTGACLNCSDPANYDFNNGSCTRKAVTCAANQYQVSYTCYNASVTCATFDSNTGKCLTCLSNLYQLNTDGSCTLIVVNCPQGQYAVGLNCVTIPSECLNFDRSLGKCLSCIKGFFVQGGVCKRIVCPDGQVPSGYGIFCVNISPLCDAYDSLTGDCLSCKQKGYAVREGKCVQIGSGLAGCAEREALGFGPCVGADLNCKTFNLITGNCDECNAGYYLDYTGHCALSSKCGAGQWSVNGECLGTPDNCLKLDSVGLCTQCINENYRLQHGQCVFFKSCLPQQFLNSAGQCVDVSPNCGTFNPTNGLCVTCKDGGTHPVSGVCCPAGQVYNFGSCVSSVALQNSYQSATGPSCAVPHPSLNFCLRCNQGYSPDYTVPYACAPN